MASLDSCLPERRLALALAATQAQREADRLAILEIAQRADYRLLERILWTNGVLSLIGRRLLELLPSAPERFAGQVRDYERQVERQSVNQQMITIRLTAALAEAGIRALPLKGPLLGERIYGTLGARASADIDLLVARDDLRPAVEVLLTLDYALPPRVRQRSRSVPDLHECLRSNAGLPEVELHWRVHHYEHRFSADMLRRAMPGSDGCLQPAAPDDLIALLLFYARDGMTGLRLLADLTGWWDRFAGALAPGEVDELAREHPAIVRALATAAVTAQQLGDLPASDVFAPTTLSRASALAVRLSNWSLRGQNGQIAANVALVDCLLSPPAMRRGLLTRHFWRDEARLCGEWSDVTLTRAGLMRARLTHMARLSVRCLIALWRLRGGRAWAPAPGPQQAEGSNAD